MNTVVAEYAIPSGQILQLVQGDITTEHVDAIVNAANEHLQHGGGVAAAIVRRGGETIRRESDEWVRTHGRVTHGEPAWTSGGNLPCRHVIHAVGPAWGKGDEDAKLTTAVVGSLRVAEKLGLSSLAMPALSTGIFGFPKERAAGVILATIRQYFAGNPTSGLKQVRLVLLDRATVDAFLKALHDHFQP